MFSWIGKAFRIFFQLLNWILILSLAAGIGGLVYFAYQSNQSKN
jgi:hypothetical protein